MSLGRVHEVPAEYRRITADIACAVFSIAWHALRIPILALLLILEPVVTLVLWGAALLGILTAFIFKFSGAVPDFPLVLVMSISIGCTDGSV